MLNRHIITNTEKRNDEIMKREQKKGKKEENEKKKICYPSSRTKGYSYLSHISCKTFKV